jgi:hypothetical protein
LSQSGTTLNKLNRFFDGGLDLPMYKDKPYFTGRRWRKVIYGIYTGSGADRFPVVAFWRFSEFPGTRSKRVNLKSEDLWTWLQNSQKEEPRGELPWPQQSIGNGEGIK